MSFAVIGLLGRKGSGKSTIAKYLAETYGAQVISFAKPLKMMCDVFLRELAKVHGLEALTLLTDDGETRPYSIECLSDPAWKEAWVCLPDTFTARSPDVLVRLFPLRWLPQKVGTEMCRDNQGASVWVTAAFGFMQKEYEASGAKLFVIDDVRFPNEVQKIHDWREDISCGSVVIKLTCSDDPIPNNPHASEDIDAIPLSLIDEAIVSHRSDGCEHLIGEFKDALERLSLSDEFTALFTSLASR